MNLKLINVNERQRTAENHFCPHNRSMFSQRSNRKEHFLKNYHAVLIFTYIVDSCEIEKRCGVT